MVHARVDFEAVLDAQAGRLVLRAIDGAVVEEPLAGQPAADAGHRSGRSSRSFHRSTTGTRRA